MVAKPEVMPKFVGRRSCQSGGKLRDLICPVCGAGELIDCEAKVTAEYACGVIGGQIKKVNVVGNT